MMEGGHRQSENRPLSMMKKGTAACLGPDAAEHVEREEQGVVKLDFQDPAPLHQED